MLPGLHRAPPELWHRQLEERSEVQSLEAVTADGAGTAAVEMDGVAGVQKTGPRPEKLFLDCPLAAPEEKVKTSRSENETRLVAVGPPGCLPSGRLQRRGLPGVGSASMQALRWLTETISSRDPTLMERRDDNVAAQPDEGGVLQLVWQLGRQLGTGIVHGQGKSRSIQSFF
jgi:hypothetical protein